jgi:hypothetical protein
MKRIVLSLILLFAVSSLLAQSTGPTFFYVATAVDANGIESVFSNERSATLSQGHYNVVLTWTASTSTVVGYNIYRSKTTGGPYTKINAALITSGVTYTDAFVPPNAPTLAAPTVP